MAEREGQRLEDDTQLFDTGIQAERAKVASATRLKLAFTLFVMTLLLALSALTFSMVSAIFDELTPYTRHDLEWKVHRGALELAQSTQLGMVVGDTDRVSASASDYVRDPEVIALAVLDASGETVFEHRKREALDFPISELFEPPAGTNHETDGAISSWATSEIEGAEVGRVGLMVSKARLEAGQELREDILRATGIGAMLALVLALAFVNFYIGPLLRTTSMAFEKLERTTEAALAATRLKSEFLANMSHEIRTPMNGIIGVIDLIRRTPMNAKQRRYVQTIESSARSLLTIINDILDFSKLEAGKYDIQSDDFEVRQVIQEVVELLAPKAHAKGIEIVQRVDATVPHSVVGDIDRVKQVLTNLVGNAIKFTDEGHVLVRVGVQDESDGERLTLRFEVLDTGFGIDPEKQNRLFESFSQVDGSLTRKHGGTGLGLAICKRLAEAMGGQVGVQSAAGKGSTFWFTIDSKRGTLGGSEGLMPKRESRVLLIVRDSAQREALAANIEAWGMQVVAARDAQLGCELVQHCDPEPYDVAVIDVFNEEEEHARRLLDLCALEGLPLVRLLSTTDSAPAESSELQQLYLTKPVRVSELYNGIVSLLDGTTVAPVQPRPENDTHKVRVQGGALVLIVDDNEINRLVAGDLLEELGYEYETADNGKRALELAASGKYAAILMDCQMPVMDGYEATRRIRELPGKAAKVPIIAATAHAMAGDREKVLAAGMDDYTAKPVRARALERLLHRWVQHEPMATRSVDAEVNAAVEANDESGVSAPPFTAEAREQPWQHMPVLDSSVPRSPRVAQVFLRSVPGDVTALNEALASGDADAVRKASHKLKGGCLSLGAIQLAEAARHIEYEAAEGRLDVATGASLMELFERIRPMLAEQSELAASGGS